MAQFRLQNVEDFYELGEILGRCVQKIKNTNIKTVFFDQRTLHRVTSNITIDGVNTGISSPIEKIHKQMLSV